MHYLMLSYNEHREPITIESLCIHIMHKKEFKTNVRDKGRI